MVLGCDIVIAADTAQFALPEPRVGRLPLDGGMVLLQRKIPYNAAMGMMLTGRRVPAAELQKMGPGQRGRPPRAARPDGATLCRRHQSLRTAVGASHQTAGAADRAAESTAGPGCPATRGDRRGHQLRRARGSAGLPAEAGTGLDRQVTPGDDRHLDPGVWGVVATPFDDTLTLDTGSLSRLVGHYAHIGVQGLTVLGVFGEAAALSRAERSTVLRTVVDVVDLPLVVGLTSLATAPAIEEAEAVLDVAGSRIAALMVQVNSPDPATTTAHLRGIARGHRHPAGHPGLPGRQRRHHSRPRATTGGRRPGGRRRGRRGQGRGATHPTRYRPPGRPGCPGVRRPRWDRTPRRAGLRLRRSHDRVLLPRGPAGVRRRVPIRWLPRRPRPCTRPTCRWSTSNNKPGSPSPSGKPAWSSAA